MSVPFAGEHIEAAIEVAKENELSLDPRDIAMEVMDIMFAQGLIQESELDLAQSQIMADVSYYLKPNE